MRTAILTILTLAALSVMTPSATAQPSERPRAGMEGRRGGAAAERRKAAWEDRILEGISVRDPIRYQRVLEIRQHRPRMYSELFKSVSSSMRARDRDPNAWQHAANEIDLTYRLFEQLQAYEAASAKEQQALRDGIADAVSALFDARQEQRRRQIARMEERLAELKAKVERRESRKDAIVERFTDRLLAQEAAP